MTWPKIGYPIYDLTLKSIPCFRPVFLNLNGGEEGNARMEGGGHDEEVVSSKKTNSRLECKNRYPIYYHSGGKMATIDTLFYDQNWLKNHTLWGRTYLYSPDKGVPPPTPPGAWVMEKNVTPPPGAALQITPAYLSGFKQTTPLQGVCPVQIFPGKGNCYQGRDIIIFHRLIKVSSYPKWPHCVSTALLIYVYKKPPAKYIFSESLIIEGY